MKKTSKAKVEPFEKVLKRAIKSDFGTQEAFAEKSGVDPSRVSQIVSGRERIKPETLAYILETFESDASRYRLHQAYVAEVAPLPDLPADLPADQVILRCEELVDVGLVERAVNLGLRCMRNTSDPAEWHRIAERVVPWHLRLGHVSRAYRLREEVERRARARRDHTSILSALAMKGNALHSIDAVTPAAVKKAHQEALAYLESWNPKDEAGWERHRYRAASFWREHALHVVLLWRRRMVSDGELEGALAAARKALAVEKPDFMVATGLEVLSRVHVARCEYGPAEDVLDELHEFGLEKGFELWEKSELTRATIEERTGGRDQAIEILERVRDRCFENQNFAHHRKADQELVRLLAGL